MSNNMGKLFLVIMMVLISLLTTYIAFNTTGNDRLTFSLIGYGLVALLHMKRRMMMQDEKSYQLSNS